MIALMRGLFSILITVAAILFALANRGTVNLVWSPLNGPVAVPLFAAVLGALGIGFIAGAFLMWLRCIGRGVSLRRQKRRIDALERDAAIKPVSTAVTDLPALEDGRRRP